MYRDFGRGEEKDTKVSSGRVLFNKAGTGQLGRIIFQKGAGREPALSLAVILEIEYNRRSAFEKKFRLYFQAFRFDLSF